MKKTIALLTVSVMALMGCDSKNANAQSQVSADVGNPDSANIMVIQEGYEVITQNPQPSGMEAMPGDAGVEVAPAGANVAPSAYPNGINVDETINETVSPDASMYEVDESIN